MTLISPACAMSQPSSMPAIRAARVFIAASCHCFVPMHGSLAHGPAVCRVDTSAKLGRISWLRDLISAMLQCGVDLHRPSPPFFAGQSGKAPARGLLATIFDAVVAVFCWGFVVRGVAHQQRGLALGRLWCSRYRANRGPGFANVHNV